MPTSAAWVISSTGAFSLPATMNPCAALINAARVRCLRRSSRLAGTRGSLVKASSQQSTEGTTILEEVSYE